ncbi:MAG: TerC family protein [Candidatus Melainabacteria bacterium]|nr:TerC family protein [Candidatus Melainabacteria bacterium]
MEWLTRTEFWAMFLTLTGLEIVLGIDNVIFHSLTIAKLPFKYQKKARIAGMSLAVLMRFVLLAGIVWFMGISKALLVVLGEEISARDIVLIGGGLFLVIKSCLELCHSDSAKTDHKKVTKPRPDTAGIIGCIIQIVILDIVFSLDSVITAVGMVNDMRAIMLAIVVSVAVMMFFSEAIGKFLQARKRVRTLAFCFIALVGAVLLAEGFDVVVPKSHIYVAGGFALLIEYGLSRLRAATKKKTKTSPSSPAVWSPPRFHYAATVLAGAPAPEPISEMIPVLSCQCKNPLSYGFCVDCGDGLGTHSLDLGKLDYALAFQFDQR